jgi:hypothetical protein
MSIPITNVSSGELLGLADRLGRIETCHISRTDINCDAGDHAPERDRDRLSPWSLATSPN